MEDHTPEAPKQAAKLAAEKPVALQCSDGVERDKVETLFQTLVEAKKKNGESIADSASLDSFTSFVKKKTEQIRKQYGCHAVEYTVEMQDGQVKLKAKAKV